MDLGLDFGTTYTVVAHVDRGNYPVVTFHDTNDDAHAHFPTVVAEDGGTLLFGFAALAAAERGAPLVRSFKRLLADPSATADTTVAVGAREVPLLDVLVGFFSALHAALHKASSLEEPLNDSREPLRTVLGVPAQAHNAQRLLTLEACRRAGFDVVRMVNEPSAASFEFAHRQARSVTSRRNLVIVYDLGGGTFDASLVQLDGTRHEVLDSFGVNRLGGDDFDEVLAGIALQSSGRSRESLSEAGWQALLDEARDAKESISPQTRRVLVEVPGGGGQVSDVVTVDVDELYAACSPLVEASTDAMAPLVEGLRVRAESLPATAGSTDELEGVAGIYVVGGASSLPLVPRMLRNRFGRRVHRSPLPSASTAIGLAIAADAGAGFSLRDRLSRGFGVFREAEAGTAVTFDPLLDRSLVTVDADSGVAPGGDVEVIRRYHAAHNIGWFRFVEYSSVDDRGVPRGELVPRGEVVFAFDPALQQSAAGNPEALHGIPVERRPDGPPVEERYTVSPDGIITVVITDLSTGHRQEAVLR